MLAIQDKPSVTSWEARKSTQTKPVLVKPGQFAMVSRIPSDVEPPSTKTKRLRPYLGHNMPLHVCE